MRSTPVFAAAALLVLAACEAPVAPLDRRAPTASHSASVAAQSAVEIAYQQCWWTWEDYAPPLLCGVYLSSAGSVLPLALVFADRTPTGSAPTWSPDATRIAFTDGSEVHMVMLADRRRTNLTNHPAVDLSPDWAPNGAKIVFQSDRDGPAELYLMNADGSDVVRLTHNVGVDGSNANPAWSPDGATIVFNCLVESGNRDICRINADGTGLVRITSDPAPDFDPSWLPNGSRIAFASGRFFGADAPQIAIMNADGSGVTPTNWSLRGPDWSSDGGSIVAYVSPPSSGCDSGNICPDDLIVMNADGSALQFIGRGSDPAWAPVTPLPPVGGDPPTLPDPSPPPPPPPDAFPVASFAWNCVGLACTFDGSASSDDIGIASRSWVFGDGFSVGNIVTPAHTFAAAGTNAVTITVTDGIGQRASSTRSVVVNDLPPAACFTSSCTRTVCTFDGRSSTDEWPIESYAWELGTKPSTTASGATVTVDYKRTGSFTVRLTVRDRAGQANSVIETITIRK